MWSHVGLKKVKDLWSPKFQVGKNCPPYSFNNPHIAKASFPSRLPLSGKRNFHRVGIHLKKNYFIYVKICL